MAEKKRVLLSEIARKSGVSAPTVSAILNNGTGGNHSRFSKETQDKVTRMANRLGYRPNRAASNLKTKRHGAIGILVKEFWYIYESRFKGLLNQAAEYQQLVFLESVGVEGSIPHMVKEDYVDGIILFEEIDLNIEKEIIRHRIPAVHVNSKSGVINHTLKFNEQSAVDVAVRHLVETGRKQVIFIGGGPGHYQLDCKPQFMKSAEAAQLHPVVLELNDYYPHPSLQPSVADTFTLFLKEHSESDAAFLSNDYFAPSFYEACRRIGKSIPVDIAVIGANDTTAARHVIPGLTSVALDREQIGHKAVRLLNEHIRKGDFNEPVEEIMDYFLIRRSST